MENNNILDIHQENDENLNVETAPTSLVYKLSQPIEYNDKKYTELHINFEKLKGKDARAISSELQAIGKTAILPSYSDEYLVRVVARASEEPIGADFFDEVSMNDFNKLTAKARAFMLKSELPIPTKTKA